MPKKPQALACDASSLISLTDSCFVHVLYFFKRKHKAAFLIPPSVEYECVERPMGLKMHSLFALRLKRAILDGVIDVVPLGLSRKAESIRWAANNSFYADGTPIRLLHQGEAEALALASEAGIQNVLIDERTTRMLSEDPEALRLHLEKELSRSIKVDEESLSSFLRFTEGMRFFRSSELLLLAYEKGYFSDYGELEEEAIEAALYRLKYSGCGVGMGEIESYLGKIRR
ncbi:MAG: hypothetical protein N3F07_03605 [Candidatus Micrarchaeota archaeon]|nr:hypothetical protein [Candidatus Micrarchaeota archaeon]